MTSTTKALAGLVRPHAIEQIVYAAMVWAADHPPPKGFRPPYTETGNSLAEEYARHTAARILASLEVEKITALVEAGQWAFAQLAGIPMDEAVTARMDTFAAALATITGEPTNDR